MYYIFYNDSGDVLRRSMESLPVSIGVSITVNQRKYVINNIEIDFDENVCEVILIELK